MRRVRSRYQSRAGPWHWVGIALMGWMVVGPVAETNAQPLPRLELSAGYAPLWRLDSDQTIPTGFYVSGAWRLTRWLSAVGEAGWHDKRETFDASIVVDQEIRTSLGGARIVPWSWERVVPFVDVLIGARRARNRVGDLLPDPDDPFPLGPFEVRTTSWALQPGAGIVWWVHDRVGTQVALHYRRTLGLAVNGFDLPENDEWRASTGITVGF